MVTWVQAEENRLVQLIHMCGKHAPLKRNFAMINICEDAAGLLSWEFDKTLKTEDTYAKVIELRLALSKFYCFINQEGIEYNVNWNLVMASAKYMREKAPMETEEETMFREKGLRNYKNLKCVFLKKKAALVPGEPLSNRVQPDYPTSDNDSDD